MFQLCDTCHLRRQALISSAKRHHPKTACLSYTFARSSAFSGRPGPSRLGNKCAPANLRGRVLESRPEIFWAVMLLRRTLAEVRAPALACLWPELRARPRSRCPVFNKVASLGFCSAAPAAASANIAQMVKVFIVYYSMCDPSCSIALYS